MESTMARFFEIRINKDADGDYKNARAICKFRDYELGWIYCSIIFWVAPDDDITISYIGIPSQITSTGDHLEAMTIMYNNCIYLSLIRMLEQQIYKWRKGD